MDSFNINIKVEKANAIKKHRQLQKIASLFRFVEICVALALLSRFSIRLPLAVKNSSEYFKDLSVLLVSPRFVFIIGNIIVITLFAKSGQFSGKNSTGKSSRSDIYEEFLKVSERSQAMHRNESENREKQSSSVPKVGENREKQSSSVPDIAENREKQSGEKQSGSVPDIAENREKQGRSIKKELKKEEICTALAIKSCERSQSEKVEACSQNNSCRDLRRTVTEKYRGSVECSEGCVKLSYPEDRMSNEEFRCTIESFIERQKKFRRDEENYYCILE
ncbi:uncharacterized protein [Euphorbia lathyris]|uniref:uncharacterized protein n=1 Tax=Euphorbia lathyris TaxID=212925 RepID=UPI003313B019